MKEVTCTKCSEPMHVFQLDLPRNYVRFICLPCGRIWSLGLVNGEPDDGYGGPVYDATPEEFRDFRVRNPTAL